MTKEEIERYIDLDNKIKNRIAQISHALHGIDSSSVTAITPNVKQCFSNVVFDKADFIENSKDDVSLHLGFEYCMNVCHIDKNILCLTDEQIYKIREYDRKQKEEADKRLKEVEKARKEQLEYEQYLRLKKKFEDIKEND